MLDVMFSSTAASSLLNNVSFAVDTSSCVKMLFKADPNGMLIFIKLEVDEVTVFECDVELGTDNVELAVVEVVDLEIKSRNSQLLV